MDYINVYMSRGRYCITGIWNIRICSYTPSSPSEVLNTEVDGSSKYNCDPNEAGAKDATVTCDGDNDCAIKCQQSDGKMYSKKREKYSNK